METKIKLKISECFVTRVNASGKNRTGTYLGTEIPLCLSFARGNFSPRAINDVYSAHCIPLRLPLYRCKKKYINRNQLESSYADLRSTNRLIF